MEYATVMELWQHAQDLVGKTGAELMATGRHCNGNLNPNDKGIIGKVVEEFLLPGHTDNKQGVPDCEEIGTEIKTTGIIGRSNDAYVAKDRLMLGMINYQALGEEIWETSTLRKKCANMLIVPYLYDKRVPPLERRFCQAPFLVTLDDELEADWTTIRNAIKNDEAQKLSSRNTQWLCAATKGPGGQNRGWRPSAHGEALVRSRAFALKAAYVTQLMTKSLAN